MSTSLSILFFLSLMCLGCLSHNTQRPLSAAISCDACKVFAYEVQTMVRANATDTLIVDFAVKFCEDFKIEDDAVCSGLVPQFVDVFRTVAQYELSPPYVCGFFSMCPRQNTTTYNVTFPKPKPPHVAPKPPSPNAPRSTILHVSDMHFDEKYQAGMNTDCGEPLCCRAVDGPGLTPNTTAGVWGDYKCDLSPIMLISFMKQLTTLDPAPEIVFWTGDSPPHDLWLQTPQAQINNSAYLTQFLRQALPKALIIPAIGNHEAIPVNEYPLPPTKYWLYEALGEQWGKWLPKDAVETLVYGGYYQVLVKPGIRAVSLNMNYCNSENAYLLINRTDPGGMIEWLINVLQSAEDNQEKVYIIGHIPPGSNNCVDEWSRLLYLVVDRYEDTIIAQFYGHTHTDLFELFYTQDTQSEMRACGVAYITPSLTPYTNINPSYRIYTVDDQTGYIVESTTYHVDLTKANAQGYAEWVWEYNATLTYNMTSLFPSDWDALVERFEEDDTLINTYAEYATSSSPFAKRQCNGTCKQDFICGMKSAMRSLHDKCMNDHGIQYEAAQELHISRC